MIDFFGPGFDAAETMGLLPRLRELAYNVAELNYVDRLAAASRAGLPTDGQLTRRPADQPASRRPRARPVRGLSQLVPSYGCSVEALDERAEGHGRAHRRDTLVRRSRDRADGIHSAIRELAFGPEELPRYLGFTRRLHLRPSRASQETRTIRHHRLRGQNRRSLPNPQRAMPYSQPTAHPIRHPSRSPWSSNHYSDLGWLSPSARSLPRSPGPVLAGW